MRSTAALLIAATVLVAAPASAQTVSAADAGRHSFQLGRALYDQRRWSEALDAFRTSQQVLPSPNTLLYLGRCQREIGRFAEAYRTLSRAAQEADARRAAEPRYAPTAEAAQREANALTDRVSFITIELGEQPPALAVRVNGDALDPSQFGTLVAVDPGAVVVEATAAGRVPFRASSNLAAGQHGRVAVQLEGYQPGGAVASTQTVTFTPTQFSPIARQAPVPTASASPLRALGITAFSAGLALGVGGLVTGLRARSLQSDLDRLCPQGCGPSPSVGVRDMVDEGNTMVTLTNVLWGVGGAMVVAGAVMWIVAPSSASSSEPFAPSLARVRPYVDPLNPGAGLVGTF